MTLNYVNFINEGWAAQQRYAEKAGEPGPMDKMDPKARYAKIIECFGHLVEESVEARVHVPRRSWKNSEPSYLDNMELRREFIAEMYDILLFHRAILAYAGITGEEFAEIAQQKHAYNQVRTDHNINGDTPAPSSPLEELQGNCQSSSF